MLAGLIELSLRYRGVVFLATAVMVLAGIAAFRELPLDAYPDTTPTQVSVNAVAPALSPLEVERQVTFPIEQAISGLPGLTEVRSVSKFGFSQITAIFEDGTDVYLARQTVGERLQGVELGAGIDAPTLGPVSTGLGEVFQYIVRSDTLSAQELRTLHHWVVRPQMLQVPGVAEINTWGGYEHQFHVVIEPAELLKYGLTLDDVADALRQNNANVGGGVADRGGEAQLIQGFGLAENVDDLASIVIAAHEGVPITIADVAEVRVDHEIRRGAVTADGEGEAVLGLGFMLMGENSRELTHRLEARLAEAQRTVPEGVALEPVYSRTDLVEQVLHTVERNLLEGALFVIAVLFIFLGNLRAGLIVALAIPLSMLFAFNAMLRFGVAGSLMSLGAIDFGLVVDSSVIMVENAAKRVEEDTSGRSIREIVRDAALEVRRPTLFGELIIAIVYLPVLTLEGVEGDLFRPMALTVLFALLGSMVLSLTLTPALATLVLRRRAGRVHHEPWVVRTMKRAYRPVVRWVVQQRVAVLIVAAAAVFNAGLLATTLGSEFVPRLREQAVVINTVRLAGVSLDESIRYGTQIERRLLERFPDEIAHIWTRTGTAEVATDPMGLELSDVFITLTPREEWTRGRTQDELMTAMADELEGMPGMRSIFTQPIEMRMNEMVAGIRADVGVKIFGADFVVLQERADLVRQAIEGVPGAVDVSVEQVTGLPILRVDVDRAAAGRFGIPVADVLAVVESLGGTHLGEIVEEQRRFPLVMRLPHRYRDDAEALGQLLIVGPNGERIPLAQVADISIVDAPSTITREWAQRRITVQANVRDRDIGSFVADVQAAVAEVPLPVGYSVAYGGQFEHLERARERLLLVVPMALLLVFALLYVTFGQVRDALLVFTGVPFAAVGGIVALWATGIPFSISAGVGFIAVSGVSVLGQLVLVSQIRVGLEQGVERMRAVEDAALSRMRPVVMTGLVAAVGFIPMALNTGVGAEVQRPLAIVVIAGVVTSTLATLAVLPALYAAWGSGGARERSP